VRIVSFLPSATEIVCSLGLADQLVAVTHECDHPPGVRKKPVVVRNAVKMSGLTDRQVDDAVRRHLRSGRSIYRVDELLLRKLDPDLILTQDLCQVCAPSGNEVSVVLKSLPREPRILWLTPRNLNGIFENIISVGEATGKLSSAKEFVDGLKRRVDRVLKKTKKIENRPRVFCVEWFDPIYCSGHWMPELVELAGGRDELGKKGRDSVCLSWNEVLAWAPEVMILTPCGYDLRGVLARTHLLARYPDCKKLPAVQTSRIYAVNANAYFARPGPRVVDGLELLAHLIHPEMFNWTGPSDAFQRLHNFPYSGEILP
jgi:iron complex transport system substrate-binding protein